MRNEIQAGVISGARFVDPVVLARVGNLELVARSVVEGFINGMHRSAHFGASVDFAEHRGYTAGDDIRRVDWKLFGRTDRFYIKEYEADTNANFACLLDVSKSMAFGSRGITKLDYGRILAACLTYMVHRQRDRVGFAAFDDDIVEYVPPSAKHMETTLHILDRLKPSKPGQLAPPMKKLAEQYRTLIREHSEALRSKFSELRIDYALINTRTSLDQALFSYLSMREQMSRVR